MRQADLDPSQGAVGLRRSDLGSQVTWISGVVSEACVNPDPGRALHVGAAPGGDHANIDPGRHIENGVEAPHNLHCGWY